MMPVSGKAYVGGCRTLTAFLRRNQHGAAISSPASFGKRCLSRVKPSDIHPSAVVSSSAKLGGGVRIGALSVVDEGVVIGNDTEIASGVHLRNCTIGKRCTIHSGVCIGQDGFGFEPSPTGEHKKKPQELRVLIDDHCEIGANTCIDRGSWRDTVVGEHSKIDNMVQIAHNVHLGRGCLIASQVGIAGSTTIGNNVMIGGQAGIAQHLKVGDNVKIAAKSGVMTHLEENHSYGGVPAVPIRDFHRQTLAMRKLARSGS